MLNGRGGENGLIFMSIPCDGDAMLHLKPMFAALFMAFALAGCMATAPREVSVPVQVPSAAPAPAVASGAIAGPLGNSLDDKDRLAASDAQLAAVDSGQKRTWRGAKGAYGFVEPGAEMARAEGSCREYTHKVYVSGRPHSGQGLACRTPDKGWRIVS